MSSRLRFVLAAIVFGFVFSANPLTAKAQQKQLTADQKQIVDTVNVLFVAARADDVAKFDTVLAPGFYMFDGGARFDGDAIMGLIKAQHAAGRRYEWNITEPDVHITGDTAWIAYVNSGSITDASGTKSQQWLESAFLEKQTGVWKIVFVHSTRVPAPVTESHGK
jgi:ketosteroid isomerase-like protein